jgi:hypothetical protein
MKKVLKILFPIFYMFESIILEVDEEVYGVSCQDAYIVKVGGSSPFVGTNS